MENKISEGEELIAEYFTEENIKFKREYELNFLQNDSKSYRKADFYLPKYKVFIEFFGRWNLDKNKEEYRIKKRVYEENKIPCVILYPDNLGILNFIFKRRLKKELEKYHMKWELFKLNCSIFIEKNYFIELIIFGFLIYYSTDYLRYFFGFIFTFELFRGIKNIFFN